MRNAVVFDFGVGGCDAGSTPQWQDVRALLKSVFDKMAAADAKVGVGRYNEARPFYTNPLSAGSEPRTVHLSVDLFVRAGEPVYAPLAGTVLSVHDNCGPQNSGPTVILKHGATEQAPEFFTLYGHLAERLSRLLRPECRWRRAT